MTKTELTERLRKAAKLQAEKKQKQQEAAKALMTKFRAAVEKVKSDQATTE